MSSDTERLEWLRRNGYFRFPDPKRRGEHRPEREAVEETISLEQKEGRMLDLTVDAVMASDTTLLDLALSVGYGPAYWRQPEPEEVEEAAKGNGLVFVRGPDRERIDAAMNADE